MAASAHQMQSVPEGMAWWDQLRMPNRCLLHRHPRSLLELLRVSTCLESEIGTQNTKSTLRSYTLLFLTRLCHDLTMDGGLPKAALLFNRSMTLPSPNLATVLVAGWWYSLLLCSNIHKVSVSSLIKARPVWLLDNGISNKIQQQHHQRLLAFQVISNSWKREKYIKKTFFVSQGIIHYSRAIMFLPPRIGLIAWDQVPRS